MPPPRPIRRFARDVGLACVAAVAVVAAYRLIRPAAPPTASVAAATAALDAALRPAVPTPVGAAVELRVYDVRDLLRGPLEYQEIRGQSDGPEGYVERPVDILALARKRSLRDEAAGGLIGLLDRLAPPAGASPPQDATAADGRLFLVRTAAVHARIAAVLDALRLANRARPAWEEVQ